MAAFGKKCNICQIGGKLRQAGGKMHSDNDYPQILIIFVILVKAAICFIFITQWAVKA